MDDIVKNFGAGRRNRVAAGKGFTARKRQRFLDALALTCNVARSAEHAGVAKTTAYRLRAADPDFAAAWRAAVEAAYDRLELLVLEHGGAGVALETPDGDRAAEEGLSVPFDFDRALSILRQYRAQREGRPNTRTGRPPKPVSREETNAALLKALVAVRRRREAERARTGGDGDG